MPSRRRIFSPFCTCSMLNVSWSSTMPRLSSSGTSVQRSSAPSERSVAGAGRSPAKGVTYMTSKMEVSWSSPFGRKR